MTAQCAPGLHGAFCQLCERNASGGARTYYEPATHLQLAHCKPCGSTAATSIGILLAILVGVAAAYVALRWAYRTHVGEARRHVVAHKLGALSLPAKGKVVYARRRSNALRFAWLGPRPPRNRHMQPPCATATSTNAARDRRVRRVGFFMIAVKVPTIYEVQLPGSVAALLGAVDQIVSVGLPFVENPLTCLGARGYADRCGRTAATCSHVLFAE